MAMIHWKTFISSVQQHASADSRTRGRFFPSWKPLLVKNSYFLHPGKVASCKNFTSITVASEKKMVTGQAFIHTQHFPPFFHSGKSTSFRRVSCSSSKCSFLQDSSRFEPKNEVLSSRKENIISFSIAAYNAGSNFHIIGEEIQTEFTKDFIPDAIMVLGGGQTPDGGVPEWVQRRLDASLILHNAFGKCPIVCMGGGTPHRPPVLSPNGHMIHEGTSCANYLLQKGLSPEVILKEWGSYDTIANGYFALVWHCIPRQWTKIVVVTSDFHMERSRLIFEWVFGLTGAGDSQRGRLSREKDKLGGSSRMEFVKNGDFLQARVQLEEPLLSQSWKSEGYDLRFVSVSDEGLDLQMLRTRREKEARSIESLKEHISQIHSLPDLHAWFHTEHGAYNVRQQKFFGTRGVVDDPNLAGY